MKVKRLSYCLKQKQILLANKAYTQMAKYLKKS